VPESERYLGSTIVVLRRPLQDGRESQQRLDCRAITHFG